LGPQPAGALPSALGKEEREVTYCIEGGSVQVGLLHWAFFTSGPWERPVYLKQVSGSKWQPSGTLHQYLQTSFNTRVFTPLSLHSCGLHLPFHGRPCSRTRRSPLARQPARQPARPAGAGPRGPRCASGGGPRGATWSPAAGHGTGDGAGGQGTRLNGEELARMWRAVGDGGTGPEEGCWP
jgi:hypothetical protein